MEKTYFCRSSTSDADVFFAVSSNVTEYGLFKPQLPHHFKLLHLWSSSTPSILWVRHISSSSNAMFKHHNFLRPSSLHSFILSGTYKLTKRGGSQQFGCSKIRPTHAWTKKLVYIATEHSIYHDFTGGDHHGCWIQRKKHQHPMLTIGKSTFFPWVLADQEYIHVWGTISKCFFAKSLLLSLHASNVDDDDTDCWWQVMKLPIQRATARRCETVYWSNERDTNRSSLSVFVVFVGWEMELQSHSFRGHPHHISVPGLDQGVFSFCSCKFFSSFNELLLYLPQLDDPLFENGHFILQLQSVPHLLLTFSVTCVKFCRFVMLGRGGSW